MAASAPLGRLGAGHVLHVLDTLAVPLIVERGTMVRRAVPLLVYIAVAALAGLRFHKVFGRNQLSVPGLRGAGKKMALGSISFGPHIGRSDRRIADPIGIAPADHARVVAGCNQSGDEQQQQ